MSSQKIKNKKVILGFSGGVDSTAAALKLKETGYDVVCLFLDVKGNDFELKKESEKIANELKLKYIYRDVSDHFKDIVIDNFVNSYSAGITPNPCIICNPNIKFHYLYKQMMEENASYIATGHYAKIQEKDSVFYISKSDNLKKDQTYMLYRLPQHILSKLIFPLEKINNKEELRRYIKDNSISNFDLPDSQEICFLPKEVKYTKYIESLNVNIKNKGFFVDIEGNILGKHNGIINFTIGQRKGLGIQFKKPMYVVKINGNTNEVVLGEEKDLYSKELISIDNFFSMTDSSSYPLGYEGLNVTTKFRHTKTFAEATIYKDNLGVKVVFKEKQRALTSGQSIVFYKGNLIIGGGFIS